jgi:hypothetical protein
MERLAVSRFGSCAALVKSNSQRMHRRHQLNQQCPAIAYRALAVVFPAIAQLDQGIGGRPEARHSFERPLWTSKTRGGTVKTRRHIPARRQDTPAFDVAGLLSKIPESPHTEK